MNLRLNQIRQKTTTSPLHAALRWATNRMLTTLAWAFICGLTVVPLRAQVNLSGLDGLSAKAKESVAITLDAATLKLASGFLGAAKGNDQDAAKLQEVLSRITSITVRVLEFSESGQYAASDLNGVRNQLRAPDWSRIVDINESNNGSGEHVEIYLRQNHERVAGITVLVSGPKELTAISIAGSIDMAELAALAGSFGIPELPIPKGKSK